MKTVAYFSAEFALDQKLKIYSGGLGVLAGGLLKVAVRPNSANYRVNSHKDYSMVGVSIFWSEGYYDQRTEEKTGWIKVGHTRQTYAETGLRDTGILLNVKVAGAGVKVRVLEVPQDKYQVCPTYLLDTDIPENNGDPLAQVITRRLYQGGEDRRLAQKIVLAAGIEALERLGYDVSIYHFNEGFCSQVALELLRRELSSGKNFREALAAVRQKAVFTTHTPDLGGNEEHHREDMLRMGCFKGLPGEGIAELMEGSDYFSITPIMLKMAKISNGVSERHGRVVNEMWKNVKDKSPIIHVTNGVDRNFWQYPEFANAVVWQNVMKAKAKYKKLLLRYIIENIGKHFSENIPILVWARRFAEYKRPHLLMESLEMEIMLKENRIQIIYAGKPYPGAQEMINIWNRLAQLCRHLPNMAILSGYELELSKMLKAGADIWLNTPREPGEASGTSGMSAAMNGAVNLSTPDGWVMEGIIHRENGYIFGVKNTGEKPFEQDQKDIKSLAEALKEVVDTYNSDKARWYAIALNGKEMVEEKFTASRMYKEYSDKMYDYGC